MLLLGGFALAQYCALTLAKEEAVLARIHKPPRPRVAEMNEGVALGDDVSQDEDFVCVICLDTSPSPIQSGCASPGASAALCKMACFHGNEKVRCIVCRHEQARGGSRTMTVWEVGSTERRTCIPSA